MREGAWRAACFLLPPLFFLVVFNFIPFADFLGGKKKNKIADNALRKATCVWDLPAELSAVQDLCPLPRGRAFLTLLAFRLYVSNWGEKKETNLNLMSLVRL